MMTRKSQTFNICVLAQSVQRRFTNRTAKVRFPARATDFSLLHTAQRDSGAHSFPIQWVPVVLSPGTKHPESETYHSSPHSVETNKDGAMPPLPSTSSWGVA
jgi:hypothetical protein